MKKLIFLVCCLIVLGSCTENYNDIEPEKPVNGTVVAIDSAYWTPVLVQRNEDHVLIYDGNEIKKVELYDPLATGGLGMFFLIIVILFAILLTAASR